MKKQLNRKARLNVRPNASALVNAQAMRLVRAVDGIFSTETRVSPCTYRQDGMVRVIAKDACERLRWMLGQKGETNDPGVCGWIRDRSVGRLHGGGGVCRGGLRALALRVTGSVCRISSTG